MLVPAPWQHSFHAMKGGLKGGVSLELGVLCEFGCSFWLNLVVLNAIHSQSIITSFFGPLVATWLLATVGESISGPSMNPAITFSW